MFDFGLENDVRQVLSFFYHSLIILSAAEQKKKS